MSCVVIALLIFVLSIVMVMSGRGGGRTPATTEDWVIQTRLAVGMVKVTGLSRASP